MNTDRELLELAAKAAEMGNLVWWDEMNAYQLSDGNPYTDCWNPLTSDGDALRLAVKLGLNIQCSGLLATFPHVAVINFTTYEHYEEDSECQQEESKLDATRRAITRAAAEIGAGMRPIPNG